jgi:hypothetical protein
MAYLLAFTLGDHLTQAWKPIGFLDGAHSAALTHYLKQCSVRSYVTCRAFSASFDCQAPDRVGGNLAFLQEVSSSHADLEEGLHVGPFFGRVCGLV